MSTRQPSASKPSRLLQLLPILQWLPRYQMSWLAPDAIAGASVWALVIPQAIAYAAIVGVAPQYGLYTVLGASVMYALFASTNQVVTGPSATVAAVTASVAVMVVATTSPEYLTGGYRAHAGRRPHLPAPGPVQDGMGRELPVEIGSRGLRVRVRLRLIVDQTVQDPRGGEGRGLVLAGPRRSRARDPADQHGHVRGRSDRYRHAADAALHRPQGPALAARRGARNRRGADPRARGQGRGARR